MIELIWAWRVWFGQIMPEDVPEQIRACVKKIAKELENA